MPQSSASHPHDVLGIARDASLHEAETAWKRLARTLHPDLHPAHERTHINQKLSEVNAAWSEIKKTPPAPIESTQYAFLYTRSDAAIKTYLAKIAREDCARATRHALADLVRFKRPRRLKTPSFLLASAFVLEKDTLKIVFEMPPPEGRAIIVFPHFQKNRNHLTITPSKPTHLRVDCAKHGLPTNALQAMGIANTFLVFPSQPTDITKAVRMPRPSGLLSLAYA